ncbi:hypothetical protein HaLaN_10662 [Haematococcus lacustris]|uniref:Uncharacterized protein n=1 Tax=Haematococcus lacustris TaxID=44745 RepID=A0A699Z638_HAELA|nr:hypothetical protein HaLaN_10662 [Haematococcus lacustris]
MCLAKAPTANAMSGRVQQVRLRTAASSRRPILRCPPAGCTKGSRPHTLAGLPWGQPVPLPQWVSLSGWVAPWQGCIRCFRLLPPSAGAAGSEGDVGLGGRGNRNTGWGGWFC